MELCAYVGRRISPVGISLELCVGDLLSTEFSSFTPAIRDTIAVETSGPVRPGISVKILFVFLFLFCGVCIRTRSQTILCLHSIFYRVGGVLLFPECCILNRGESGALRVRRTESFSCGDFSGVVRGGSPQDRIFELYSGNQ